MIFINAYKYISDGGAVQTMLFRYAVISRVFGVKIPTDIEIKTLSEDTANEIRSEKHRQTLDNILFLFGAGVISEKTVYNIFKNINSDFSEDIAAAENAVILGNNSETEDKLSEKQIEDILLCCSNSKIYPEIQPVSFDEARQLLGLPHISFVDGMVKINDKEYFKFLVSVGEDFGTLTNENRVRIESEKENLLNCEEIQSGRLDSEYYPFAINLKRIIRYTEIYDKLYGREFIQFAIKNSIAADEKFIEKYDEYVRRVKLHFTVKSYKRKRKICGDKANWFDYAASSESGVANGLSADNSMDIDLDVKEIYSDSELTKKAISRYRNIYMLDDGAVIEVFHGDEKLLYIIKNSVAVPLDNETFHTLLFDFNKIWSIIKLCSRQRKIKVVDGKITIPEALMNEINENEREYAERIIKEQYQKMQEQRKNNKLFQTLSEIKAAAEAERANIENKNAAKEQEQKNIEEKKNNRLSATEG